MESKLWTIASSVVTLFGILILIVAIQNRAVDFLGMALILFLPGILGILYGIGKLMLTVKKLLIIFLGLIVFSFGIILIGFALDTGQTIGYWLATLFMGMGIVAFLDINGKLSQFLIKTFYGGQEAPPTVKAPKYVYIISILLGLISAQFRIKFGTFDDNHLIAIVISTIIVYLFFYRKYREKKIATYFIVGTIVGYLITILLAAYLISTLI